MPVENLVSLRQTNAVAIFFGGEIKLENLFVHILRDADALVTDLGHHPIVLTARRDDEWTAIRHSLHSVENYVQQRLFH